MSNSKIINFSLAIKQAMFDAMTLDKKVHIYGLGVGTSGNIYGTTKGFKEMFGENRIFDAPAKQRTMRAV